MARHGPHGADVIFGLVELHRTVCVVELAAEQARLGRCTPPLSAPVEGPSWRGDRLLLRVGTQVYWMDRHSMNPHPIGPNDAEGDPVWTAAGGVRMLGRDRSQTVGEVVRTCTLEGSCVERSIGAKAWQPAWREDTVGFVSVDGVYLLDLRAEASKPQRVWEPGDSVRSLVWRDKTLIAEALDDTAAQITLSEGAPATVLDVVASDGAAAPVVWNTPVWTGLADGRIVVYGEAGVVLRLPGDVGRIW